MILRRDMAVVIARSACAVQSVALISCSPHWFELEEAVGVFRYPLVCEPRIFNNVLSSSFQSSVPPFDSTYYPIQFNG